MLCLKGVFPRESWGGGWGGLFLMFWGRVGTPRSFKALNPDHPKYNQAKSTEEGVAVVCVALLPGTCRGVRGVLSC